MGNDDGRMSDDVAYEPQQRYGVLTTEPVYPADTLADEIREALADPAGSVPALIRLIEKKVSDVGGTSHAPHLSLIRQETLQKFLNIFPPGRWTLVQWWSLHYAVQSQYVANKTLEEIAAVLGFEKKAFFAQVKVWRKRLGISAASVNVRQDAQRIGWKKRRKAALVGK